MSVPELHRPRRLCSSSVAKPRHSFNFKIKKRVFEVIKQENALERFVSAFCWGLGGVSSKRSKHAITGRRETKSMPA